MFKLIQQVLLRFINSHILFMLFRIFFAYLTYSFLQCILSDILNLLCSFFSSLDSECCFDPLYSLGLPTKPLLNGKSPSSGIPRPTRVESNFGFGFLVYDVNNSLLTKTLLESYIRSFWKLIFPGHGSSNFAAVYITIKYEGNVFKSLGKASKVNVKDLERYIRYIAGQIDIKNNQYKSTKMYSIYFAFKILSVETLNDYNSVIHDTLPVNETSKTQNSHGSNITVSKVFGYDLPNNLNLLTWGKVIQHEGNRLVIEFSLNDTTYYYIIQLSAICNHVIISDKQNAELGGLILLEFFDYPEKGSTLNFTRKVKNLEYIYRDGSIVITMENKQFNSIVPQRVSKTMFNKILTFDIETRTLNGVMSPYCICYHDGERTGYVWLSKFNSVDLMVEAFIRLLLTHCSKPGQKRYNGYTVYAHVFSKFDSIFILKPLIKICSELKYQVHIIKKESDIINIRITGFGLTINFRDSFLLLPASLRDLAKSFNLPIEHQKGFFPFDFVNQPDVSLDYKGQVPDFKYFSNITLDQYNEYANKYKRFKWDLKREAIIYCELDCISLYHVLIKFSELIFNELQVSLKYTPTTSSLALRVFRTKFLEMQGDIKIPIITGEPFDFIKQSYTGGPVEVFEPYGEHVYHYDVNSLYPYVMHKYPMPVGDLTFFEGNILKYKDKPAGFFEVEIETPKDLHIPVLQTRLATSEGTKTLAPLGKWKGIYSSVEIYNAMENFGYNFNVLRGYIYKESALVYEQYVNYFSNIKANTPKTDSMYLISKLLMNSLYGKTGQGYKFEDTLIVTQKELLKLIQNPKVEISTITELDKDLTLITCINNNKYEAKPDNVIRSFNGSIVHASLITASARVEMYNSIKLLTELGYKIYYMDTDSLVVNKPLPAEMIDAAKLGKFKLENIYQEAVFLAPKVYAGITTDGREVIKIKGLNYDQALTYNKLKTLLTKDSSLVLEQNKMFTKLEDTAINIIKQQYSLMPTENRRALIYKNNILTGTKPYVI